VYLVEKKEKRDRWKPPSLFSFGILETKRNRVPTPKKVPGGLNKGGRLLAKGGGEPNVPLN